MSYIPNNAVLHSGSVTVKEHVRKFTYYECKIEAYRNTLDSDAQKRLDATLARTRAGFAVDLVTPYIGKSIADKTEARRQVRDQVLTWAIPTGYKQLDAAEIAQAEKVGPLSIMVPFSERRESLQAYWSKPGGVVPYVYDPLLLEQAFLNVKLRLEPSVHLKALSIDEAFDHMPKGTSLGAPFFTKNKKFYPQLVRLARDIEESGYDSKKFDLPAILFWRGQSRGLTELPKQRAVWGYPHAITILEARIGVPFIELLKTQPQFSALVSNRAVEKSMSYILNAFLDRFTPHHVFSIDFSSFDQLATSPIGGYVFDLIRYCFRKSDKELIDYIEDRFFNIPLIHPDGIWYGRHGVPSGSGFTNSFDSLYQMIFWEYFALWYGRQQSKLKPVPGLRSSVALGPCQFQGDDGVVTFKLGTNLSKVRRLFDPDLKDIQRVANWFGMILTVDKGGISRDTIYYCQNIYMKQYHDHDNICLGVRPLERALSGMLSFETPRDKDWVPADTTLRALQQLEQCREHPKLVYLCDWLLNHDRLLRDYSIHAIVDMAGGLSEAEARLKEKSGLYGKPSILGIYQYKCVRILQRLKDGESLGSLVGV